MSGAMLFALEQERFALPLGDVREVLRTAWPKALPGALFSCLGLLEVRGERIALLDLAALLGLRRPHRREVLAERILANHVLVLSLPTLPMALLVDAVLGLGEEVEEERSPPGMDTVLGRSAALVIGRATAETGEFVPLLDPRALLGAGRQLLLRRAVQHESKDPRP